MDKINIKGNLSRHNLFYSNDLVVKARFEVDLRGRDNSLRVEEGVTVTNLKVLYKGSNSSVSIGRNCRVGGIIIVEDNCNVVIGDGTKINNNATRIHCGEFGTSIKIGANCLLANVRFRTSDQHSIVDQHTGERLNKACDIKIEDNVWLAEEVNVYKGVTIATGSVVAARSTVTKSLPSHCLCAGTPAKVVKEHISWDHKKL
ncbi:acyltransferase [Cobetia amphilecti]|uniref:acyltransferase n=1 Tax=Cobetia amphilecti TaxID=1055104 RepID=UPI001C0A160B|nr:acyltransferase [Cobetia amphilecti]MBU3008583.1 hypothetical protein [Cobetia amphilecti]